jgi:hypothetical protein
MRKPKLIITIILLLTMGISLFPQQEKKELSLSIDGSDSDNEYSLSEVIQLGSLDHLGMNFGGDFPYVKGRTLGGETIFDQSFKGVMYEFTPLTGGNNKFIHPNSALSIRVESPGNWQLSVSALVSGHPSVSVDQLLYKEDKQREYTPLTPSFQVTSRDIAGIHHLFYDLALRLDENDKPGEYNWQITFILVSN